MRLVVLVLLAGCSFGSPSGGERDAQDGDGGPVIDASTPPDAQISFIIQAEDATRMAAPVTTAWVAATTPSGFTGTGVMTLQPNAGVCDPAVEPCPSLEFDVTIAEPHTYHFFVRMYASNSAEDSLYYAIDVELPRVVDTDEVNPAWRWRGNASLPLAPGLHTLWVWNREGRLHLDAVALMPSATPPP